MEYGISNVPLSIIFDIYSSAMCSRTVQPDRHTKHQQGPETHGDEEEGNQTIALPSLLEPK